jgi:hypothetical protein
MNDGTIRSNHDNCKWHSNGRKQLTKQQAESLLNKPQESPDDWVTQDRVPPRKNIDQVRWSDWTENRWVEICGWWEEPEGLHGFRHEEDGTILAVRCRRKDLPSIPDEDEWVEIDKTKFPDLVPREGVDVCLMQFENPVAAEGRDFVLDGCLPIGHETWNKWKFACRRKNLPNVPVDPGEGYRLLKNAEFIQIGDELLRDGQWVPSKTPGNIVHNTTYRRREEPAEKMVPTNQQLMEMVANLRDQMDKMNGRLRSVELVTAVVGGA